MADWKRSIPRDQRWGGCLRCIHDRRDGTCVAFPNQIPIVIASGEVDHLVIRPGQVGDTLFEPRVVPVDADGRAIAHSRSS
jgi:hypothetical protein